MTAGCNIGPHTGVILVDHGSRRAESNAMLELAAQRFQAWSGWPVVEPAHMELAAPTIAEAFDRCVARGAQRVVVFPYFLSPGRHWTEDIPALTRTAAAKHPGVEWIVTAPFGLHPAMMNVIAARIQSCLAAGLEQGSPANCELCEHDSRCRAATSATKSDS
jgi:sirohydrochlorin ferrochelatase